MWQTVQLTLGERNDRIMQQVIYLDVLIVLNIYVSYFLFLGAARLMSFSLKKVRLLFGSLAGGAFSLIILFDLSDIELIAIKLLMGCALVLVVFGSKNLLHTLKCGLYFFLVNFIYGGLMLALWTFFAPSNMAYKNGIAYFDISALALVISTIIAYLAISLFCYLLNKRSSPKELVGVTVSLNGRETMLTAFADTGNKLCDIFTGLPVVVAEYDAICSILPQRTAGYFKDPTSFEFEGISDSEYSLRLKLIPVSVVGHEFALPAFKPDNIMVNNISKDAMIAVTTQGLSNGSFNAIINTVLL